MRRWIAGAALAMLLLGIAALPADAAPRVPFLRGVTFGEWGPTGFDPSHAKRTLRRLARSYHVDAVTIFVVWNQRDASATAIAPGAQTVPTRNLVAAIRAARSEGMRVVLRPYVDLADGGWRGDARPASVDAWFRSYRRFLLKFASLARREHASGFVVGSELVSLSGESARWRELVAAVRRRFPGFLTYQANWTEHVDWWDALDAISVSAYYPLTTQLDYTVEDLLPGWRRWVDELDALRRRFGKPVMFGEIGYRTVRGGARAPWDVDARDGFSTAAQQIGYEAALRTWWRVPWFRGFNWWYVPADAGLVRGQRGGDHRPSSRALGALGRWYAKSR